MLCLTAALPLPFSHLCMQCTLNWTFASKWVIIASMPILAIACTLIVAILVKVKNYLLEK